MSNKLLLGVGGVAAVLILVLAGVLLMVASGGDDGGSGDKPAATKTEDSGDDGGDTSPASGELRLRGDDPLFLDPAVAQDAGSALYIVEIFSGLVRLDRDLAIQPDLAESWDISPDGKVYTFTLNKSATFQDGRPVTAEDVKFSFERALSPGTASVVAENFMRDIVGARDVSRGRATELAGLKVVNDSTVQITLDAAKTSFLYKMTYPATFVVDSRQITANPKRWSLKPNGTGPYKLKEWKLGERIVLEAYAKHHLGAPTLQTVRYELSGGSALVAYEDGDIDITGVGLDDLARVQEPGSDLNDEYVQTSRQSIDYIGFNVNVPPFDDVNVRQAFALSVDRAKIAEVILENAVPIASGVIPSGVPGYTTTDKTYPYDPARAKALLAQSKYANNMPEITLAESGAGATVGPTTEAIVQFWKDNLGVDVKIEQAESGTFFSDIDEGRYQMFHLGWIMDYPDPDNVLDQLFHSTSRQNSTRYSNPDMDAKIEAARIEPDTEKRLALFAEIEKIIIDDAVWVPLFFDTTHGLVKPYVKNFKFTAAIVERFRDVQVER